MIRTRCPPWCESLSPSLLCPPIFSPRRQFPNQVRHPGFFPPLLALLPFSSELCFPFSPRPSCLDDFSSHAPCRPSHTVPNLSPHACMGTPRQATTSAFFLLCQLTFLPAGAIVGPPAAPFNPYLRFLVFSLDTTIGPIPMAPLPPLSLSLISFFSETNFLGCLIERKFPYVITPFAAYDDSPLSLSP